MNVFIFEEGGHQSHRTENPYRIMVNGQVFKTPEGTSCFWTEADALRACAKYLGFVPQEKIKFIHKNDVDR